MKPIRVGIVGVYQSGKSLLINCLIKRSLAVVGNGNATTHTIVKYQYGEDEKVECRVEGKTRLSSFDELRQLNQDASAEEIVITVDCPLLKKFTLIDMPGTGYDETDNSAASKAIKDLDVAIVIESNFKAIGSDNSSSFKAIHLLNRKKVPYYFVMNCSNMVDDHWNPYSDWNENLAINNRAKLDVGPPITSPFRDRQVPIVNLMWYWYSIADENDALLNQSAIKNNLCQYVDEYGDLGNGCLKKDLFQKASNFELINKIFSMDNLAFLELKKELKELREELCPVGTIQTFAFNGIREGWMICEGQSLNVTDYPELFEAIGTTFGGDGENVFNIPDLRDRFVRGWNGNGDEEREFGSYQKDAFQKHEHEASMDSAGSHSHKVKYYEHITHERAENMFSTQYTYHQVHSSYCTHNVPTDSGGEHNHKLSVNAPKTKDGNVRVANETRPKNVALLFCIKVR